MEFNEELNMIEAVNEKLKDAQEYEIKTILNKLKLTDHQMLVKYMSGGQKKRLSLAIALIKKADLYLLDEPTNHLDQDMILWLEAYLQKLNGAIIMVTHDRYFLNRITNHMVEIDKGKLYSYQGNYADYLEQREARYEYERAIERKRQNFLRTEIEWIRAGAQARSTKSKSRIQHFEQIAAIDAPQEKQSVALSSVASRLGGKIIELYNVTKGYESTLIEDFTESISRNDRIGIIGNNGCGKSTLLKMMIGEVLPDEGRIEVGDTVKIGYFGQENTVMDESMRIIDYVKTFGEYVETADHSTITVSQMLEKFLFIKDEQYNLIGRCSGGEKRRLYLCCILMGAPNVLLLDEPTNDLDTDTLTILEDYLETFKGAVVAVSHDRYFVDKTCNRLWVFDQGRISNVIEDYSSYLEKLPVVNEKIEKKMESKPIYNSISNRLPTMTAKEKNELAKLTERIPELEEIIEDKEQQLGLISDYQKIMEISNQLEQLRNEYEIGSERWLELSEKEEEVRLARKNY